MTADGTGTQRLHVTSGTPLSEAKLVFEGEKTDVAADAYTYLDRDVPKP